MIGAGRWAVRGPNSRNLQGNLDTANGWEGATLPAAILLKSREFGGHLPTGNMLLSTMKGVPPFTRVAAPPSPSFSATAAWVIQSGKGQAVNAEDPERRTGAAFGIDHCATNDAYGHRR